MKNSNNKNTTILLALLIAVFAIIYKNMFAPTPSAPIEGAIIGSTKIEEALSKIESIDFNMAVFNDPRFSTFKSIETELPSITAGKANPFASVLAR